MSLIGGVMWVAVVHNTNGILYLVKEDEDFQISRAVQQDGKVYS
jgi:hypothetical protein